MYATFSGVSLRMAPRPPFRFDYLLSYFTRRAGELVDRVEGSAYRRLFRLPSGLLLADVRQEDDGVLRLTVAPALAGVALSDAAVESVAATLRRTLGLDDDLSRFHAVVASD